MERDLADLSLKDEEDEILLLQIDSGPQQVVQNLYLVGYFLKAKSVAKQLGDFDGEFLEYDSKSLAQSRRAAVVSSFWLREDGEEGTQGCNMERGNGESGRQGSGLKMDPILEANLDGDGSDNFGMVGNTFKIGGRDDMDHDGEENPIEGGEGKKCPRNDTENHKVAKVIDSLALRRLRHLLKMYNHQIVFFMETKLSLRRMENVRQRCGFFNGLMSKLKDLEGFDAYDLLSKRFWFEAWWVMEESFEEERRRMNKIVDLQDGDGYITRGEAEME
ncbi:hypothetical protein Gorai_004556, partial [Gossypium raimondii]|nr:hypothetical protein [Gossypium raimondii]